MIDRHKFADIFYDHYKSKATDMQDPPVDKAPQGKDDASLMSLLQKQLNFNEAHLENMERFLEQKRVEVVDLQKYLFEEFQHIQDFKDKKRRLRGSFSCRLQPLLARFRTFLRDIEQLAPQVCAFAFKQIEVLSGKAAEIIQNKEAALREKNAEIIKLQTALKLCSAVKKQQIQTNLNPTFANNSSNTCKPECRLQKENLFPPPSLQKRENMGTNQKHTVSRESLHDRVAEIYWPRKQKKSTASRRLAQEEPQMVQEEVYIEQVKAGGTQNLEEGYLPQTSRGKHIPSSSDWRMRRYNKSEHSHSMNQLAKNQLHYEPIDPDLRRGEKTILRDRSVKKIGEEIKRSLKEGFNRTGERREEIRQKISRLRERGEGRQANKGFPKSHYNQQ